MEEALIVGKLVPKNHRWPLRKGIARVGVEVDPWVMMDLEDLADRRGMDVAALLEALIDEESRRPQPEESGVRLTG